MANRLKEDEKNERIIRGLLKHPENRRCINCNSLGTQYVCTNFSTFVCTTCSGIHREFTHRVKSISMAKFTSQEVSALQGGGNASAKEIYLKEWDTQRHSFPDSSNVERLRHFIKHVYVDRRYTGERSFDKLPRVKGEIEDENRSSDPYQGGSRSPPYEDTYDYRYSDRHSPGGRSPGYEHGSRPYGDYGRSPARTEIVNDWRRDDRFGNGRRSDENRISDGSSRSPDLQKDQDMSSPPMVRPVREILGESVSPLRVVEPSRADDGRPADVSVRTKRTASSSSLASSNGNPAELKVESSLIDFDAVPDPTVNVAVPQTQQSVVPRKQATVYQTQQPTTILSNVQPTTSSNVDNWANFDPVAEVKVSQALSNASSLESLFSELSVPAPVTGPMAGASGNVGAPMTTPLESMLALPSDNSLIAPLRSSFGIGATGGATPDNSRPLSPSGASPASFGSTVMLPNSGGNSFANAANGGQWPSMQHPHSMFPSGGVQPQILTPASVQAQSWNSLLETTAQGPSGAAPAQATQAVLKPTIEATSGVGTQPYPAEVRPSGRKELPVDLFTSNYPSFHAPVPGWQTGPFHGIGLPMQYNIAAPVPTFPQQSKSTNPFDAVREQSSVQTQTFPSMASLQGALPNMGGPAGLLQTSRLGAPSTSWIPPHAPTYASEMPLSSYVGQKASDNISVRQQGMAGFPLEGPSFGTLNSNGHPNGLYSAPPANSSSVGGNPFS